ncbi:hypothetical protein D9611_011784 [Ephemerocybe angulata]|uniref:Uncharacterized protein n=1 Tax=Ephemerocybe angulata TaxID=980116 RepID=A0A8H5C5C6_9AGAR|nr:hypothetical protein D9611_011784 [Tulosesus angulatus]
MDTPADSNGDPTQCASILFAAYFLIITMRKVEYGESSTRSFPERLVALPILGFGPALSLGAGGGALVIT